MTRYTCLILISFFLHLTIARPEGQSQDTIHLKTTLKYRPGDNGYSRNSGEILREIGKEILLEPSSVKIFTDVTLAVSRSSSPDSAGFLYVLPVNALAGGNVQYRGFNIAKVLVPSFVTLDVRHQDRSDSNQFSMRSYPLVRISGENPQKVTVSLDSWDPVTDTVLFSLSKPFFDEDALVRFRLRIQMINDYYAASLLLDTMCQRAGRMDFSDAASLPSNYFRTIQIVRAVALIRSRDFQSTLLAGNGDPLRVIPRTDELYRTSRSMVYNVMDQLDRTSAIPPNHGDGGMAAPLMDDLMGIVQMSMRMNSMDGRLFRDYLAMNSTVPVFPDDHHVNCQLALKFYPALAADYALIPLRKDIYRSYCSRSSALIRTGNNAEAALLLGNAWSFTEPYPELRNDGILDSLRKVAATGIFSSYLGIAETCINSGKFVMAENYLSKAEEYGRQNTGLVMRDSLYEKVAGALFYRRLEDCDNRLAAGHYTDAVDCYTAFEISFPEARTTRVANHIRSKKETAWKLLYLNQGTRALAAADKGITDSASYWYVMAASTLEKVTPDSSVLRMSDSLLHRVRPLRFNDLAAKGYYHLSMRQDEKAWACLEEAREISKGLNLAADSVFMGKYREALRYHLLNEISLGTRYIWRNQFDSAYMFIAREDQYAEAEGLGEDSAIVAAVHSYKQKAVEKDCANFREEADLLRIRAARNLEAGRFDKGLEQLLEIRKLEAQKPNCSVYTAGISDSVWKYKAAAVFQQDLASLDKVVAAGNYTEALQELLRLTDYYRDNNLERFGIDTLVPADYIRSKRNSFLIRDTFLYYLDQKDYGEASLYLEMLQNEGYPAKDLKKYREMLEKGRSTKKSRA